MSPDDDTGAPRAFDADDRPLPEVVVESVASLEAVEPTDLPPLYYTIDPGALVGLDEGMGDARVTFAYAGYEITIDGSDTVLVGEAP